MSLSIGIIGLPNVGKSTLFNALLKKQEALAANYPFATIEPNVGVVDVPDERVARLGEVSKSKKTIPTFVKFYDIAGLVKGAHRGEGLGNQFLGHIRKVDALLHLARDFSDTNVARAGSISPGDDISIVNTELILADIEQVSKHIQRYEKLSRTNDKKAKEVLVILNKILKGLNNNLLASAVALTDTEKERIKEVDLLTSKPVIYVLNVDEDALTDKSEEIKISAKLEEDLIGFSEKEKQEYLNNLGISNSGLNKVINECYRLLDLVTFFTSGEQETRAWSIKRGTAAKEAAGKIHTDISRGFIGAEVIKYGDFIKHGDLGCKQRGLMRLEGKEYIVKEGDVIYFRFNV